MPGQGRLGPACKRTCPCFVLFFCVGAFLTPRHPHHPLPSASGQKLPFWLLAGRSLLARNVHILLGPYSKHTSSLGGEESRETWGASFDPVIPQMFAEPLLCLGRYQAGHWSAQAVKAGVCSLTSHCRVGETDKISPRERGVGAGCLL